MLLKLFIKIIIIILIIFNFIIVSAKNKKKSKQNNSLIPKENNEINFIIHTVEPKNTLFSISKRYKVSIEKIKQYNKIKNNNIFNGQRLKIPQAKINTKLEFIWPVKGRIISGFGMTNKTPHKGIDISAKPGTPVKASFNGEIKFVGVFNRLKNIIIIKHDAGFYTVYGNLDEIKVEIGQNVSVGETIGTVASNLNSLYSFLHFEIRQKTSAKNPLSYL